MSRPVIRAVTGVGALALGTLGLGAVAGPAAADPSSTCGTTMPAATLVATGICQVLITTPGSGTFTAPSGITKLSAVLVGGGAASVSRSSGAYGGNGGGVEYVDSVPLTGGVDYTVGAGGVLGTGDVPSNGGPTALDPSAELASAGGGSPTVGNSNGRSGTPQATIFASCTDADGGRGVLGAGGGAGGAATAVSQDTCPVTAGPGLALHAITGVDPALFPASADDGLVLGAGGAAASDGGSAAALSGPGAGGNAVLSEATTGQAGADGAVIFRYAALAASATTTTTTAAVAGATVNTGGVVSSSGSAPLGELWAGLIGFGVLLMAAGGWSLTRRRRRTE